MVETILGLSHPTLDKWSSFDSGVTKGQFIVSVNYCQLTREKGLLFKLYK